MSEPIKKVWQRVRDRVEPEIGDAYDPLLDDLRRLDDFMGFVDELASLAWHPVAAVVSEWEGWPE